MNPRCLILVSGLPGCGKSFFAEKLAAKIGARYLSSDRIRNAIHLLGRYTRPDKVSVYKEMLRQAGNLLREKYSVVVDGTFHQADKRKWFLDLAKEKSINAFCFEVWADESLITERLKQKRADSEADFKVYQLIKGPFEPWTTPCLKLHSMENNISLMLDEAIDYLEEENV